MGYPDSLMADGEQILYRGRQHWLAPLSDSPRALALMLAGGIVFILATFLKADGAVWQGMAVVSAVLLVVGILWLGVVYLTWRSEQYLVTTRRVIKVEGVLDKKSGDSNLEQINDAVLKQGLLARLLRYGDLQVLTANEQHTDLFEMLAHVVDFKRAMLDAKNDLEDGLKRPVDVAPATSAPASGHSG